MKIRGIYTIAQNDRILREEEIRLKAQDAIGLQIMEAVKKEMSPSIIKEEPSPKYPFGRYYLDLDVEVTEF